MEIGDADAVSATPLVVLAEQQPRLHLPADAAQRRGGQHAFGRATRAHIDIDTGLRGRGGDDAADVAVADQHDAGAGLAHLGDQLGMTRPVEDAHDEVGDRDLFGSRQLAQILCRSPIEIDEIVRQPAADRDLVHVDVGRIEEMA